MKVYISSLVVFLFVSIGSTISGATDILDMRVLQETAHESAEQLRAKALAEKEAARREEKEAREKIVSNRELLTGEITRLKSEIEGLESAVSRLPKRIRSLTFVRMS